MKTSNILHTLWLPAFIAAFLSCGFAACGKDAATTPPATRQATTQTAATKPTTAPPHRAPLDTGRPTIDLSGEGWKLWYDKTAPWQDDKLLLPPVDISQAPTTQPTIGWEAMYRGAGGKAVNAHVPGTVEEYLWGAGGDTHDLNGNCQGVSYWWRELVIPADWRGKRAILHFDACRLRSEVYVNEKLTGYDAIGNTPFDVDITDAIKFGDKNRLVVRITNPSGKIMRLSYDWADYGVIPWGNQWVPSSHGFGGITGDVYLIERPQTYVADIYVKNKPSPSASRPTDVDVELELRNDTGIPRKAELLLKVYPKGQPENVVFSKSFGEIAMEQPLTRVSYPVSAPEALLWDPDHPNLYECEAQLRVSPGGDADSAVVEDKNKVTFGFRWFSPEKVGTPNAMLTLNGKRVMLRSSISWNYYQLNGMYPPTEEILVRNIQAAKTLGLNMLAMHRTIGPRVMLNKADEMGLMLYCEPGGYKTEDGDAAAHAMSREKLLRMIRRDRSHPSIVVWGMINEYWILRSEDLPEYARDIVDAHKLDPTRTIVMASGQNRHDDSAMSRSWMMPYETQVRNIGWYDEHRAGGPGAYHDNIYRGPDSFYCNDGPDDEIIFWGEDGAISSPPQLDSLRADYEQWGRMGWDGDDYIRWQKGYAAWLDSHAARKAFPTVNALCRSIGNIAYYYQGRVIENCRIADRTDGYSVNGWEDQKMDSYSGIVDIARRLKGDPELIAHYNQPLYVAVKIRHKLAEPGTTTVCDFFIVNEKDVKGDATLHAAVHDPAGKELFQQDFPVKVTGGDRYGELLLRDVKLNVGAVPGYTQVTAELRQDGKTIATGHDEAFVVGFRDVKLPPGGIVQDITGNATTFLENLGYKATTWSDAKGPAPFIVTTSSPLDSTRVDAFLQRVHDDGTTLIILSRQESRIAERWAMALADRKIVKYDGLMEIRGGWVGGGFFTLDHPMLDGLPKSQGCNWEYQLMQIMGPSHQKVDRTALYLTGDEAVIGGCSGHEPNLATAVGVIHYGKGKIVLSTVDILPYLDDANPAHPVPATLVEKRLFMNMLSGKW